MRRWFLLAGFLMNVPLAGLAQSYPDLVVFDEDDLNTPGYYDASWGFQNLPSQMVLGGPNNPKDKLPITSSISYTGLNAGVIQWTSVSGGGWGIFIASIGWQGRDASGYDSLTLFLNGPAAILPAALPKVALEGTNGSSVTAKIDLSSYLPQGLDSDTTSWQRVSIPLTAFQPYGNFLLTEFKDVNFWQNQPDGVPHTLWIDNLRIVASASTGDSLPPSAPTRLITRVGDHSIVLHWNPVASVNLLGYNAYRGTAKAGPYVKLNSSLSGTTGLVDFNVANLQTYWYLVRAVNGRGEGTSSDTIPASPKSFATDEEFLDYLEQTALDFFWYESDTSTGLIRDRSEPWAASSVAAVGFGLTAFPVGVERGWLTRAEAAGRTAKVLETLWSAPQGAAASGVSGYNGWFYHFLDMRSGLRTWDSELSSIDTGLLIAGVLFAQEYYTGSDSVETHIRTLAGSLFDRIDWQWMTNGLSSLTMGWFPVGSANPGFISARWIGYNEAMILNLIGIGANVNPLPSAVWTSWLSGYQWKTYYGYDYVWYPALFTHQYSHCWIDFRGRRDSYMRSKGIDYAENTRRATMAQWEYAKANPGGWTDYGANVWGFTACDGPNSGPFAGYRERGAPAGYDDGTIAPTAAGGSLPFAPAVSLPTMKYLYAAYRDSLWTPYGFRDAFNRSANWWGPDVIGIDQGPILLMAENYRSGVVWKTFMKSAVIRQGLQRAGFDSTTQVANAAVLPPRYELSQNFPNPFNPSTVIEYTLAGSGRARLTLFDLLGREVAVLVDGEQAAGTHRIVFGPRSAPVPLASGVYFLRLTVGDFQQTRRMVLVR